MMVLTVAMRFVHDVVLCCLYCAASLQIRDHYTSRHSHRHKMLSSNRSRITRGAVHESVVGVEHTLYGSLVPQTQYSGTGGQGT